MADERDPGVALDAAWDRLHTEARFRPRYPSEAVVRFLARHLADAPAARLLDLGCGAGRHLALAADFRLRPVGLDYSSEGLVHADAYLSAHAIHGDLVRGRMDALPFADVSFDSLVSYGVVNYSTESVMRTTIGEIRRVLRPGGHALVVTRSTDDCRFGQGQAIGPRSFVLGTDGTNEGGMVMTFLDEAAIADLFSEFAEITLDRVDFSTGGRSATHVDWIIEVRR